MAHAELVEGVLVRGREVGDHDVGGQKLLVHRHVDDARVRYLVGPRTLQPGVSDRRLDDVFVGLVQVQRSACLEVGLLPKTHHDEAGALGLCLGSSRHESVSNVEHRNCAGERSLRLQKIGQISGPVSMLDAATS